MMIGKVVVGLSVLLGFGLLISGSSAEERFAPQVTTQKFVVIGNGDRAVVGAEFMGAVYDKEATMRSLEAMLAKIPEEKRLATPEYLIIRQYKMILAGDLKGIIADYKSDDDKKAAQKTFGTLASMQKYCLEKTNGIQFQTKCQFGDWVRIKYKRLNKKPKGFAMPWAVYLQKFGERYYFVTGPREGSIFNPAAEAWPYWTAKSQWGSDRLNGLNAMTIMPPDDKATDKATDKSNGLKVYFRPDVFPEGTTVFGKPSDLSGRQLEIWRSIKKVIETYRKGNFAEIAALWDAERRRLYEANPEGVEFAAVTKFWNEAKDASIDFMLDAGEYCWVYIVPKYESKDGEPAKKGRVKILCFHTVDGKHFLTDVTRFDTPPKDPSALFTEQIVTTPEFRLGLVEATNE